ncbi:BTAD domain-containing putative transcriptional regulator [Actinoplanes sp. NPDC051494]|uniref:AfsR/SARP family transcriptional regulator n=1 Tax=Actinoplanes sp. NPDC051494 TaxID=3363907 RepID=UPI0037936860
MLAILLLHAGRIVGVEELVDAVWEHSPPATARGQLQTCVSRLRRQLPPGVIRTDPAGYRLVIGPEELDAETFTRLSDRARFAGVAPEDGAKLFREALALWRGPALSGIETAAVRRLAAVLDERRGAAAEDWIDLELAAGHEREIVAELTGLVERYPLRERLRGQLMLTLHRLHRPADALAEFRRARRLLGGELGMEPGPELQDLHRRILTGEVAAPMVLAGPLPPVRNLPRAVGDFTGREEAVQRLVRAAATTTVLSIDGMAGSGKTTLALRVAELLGDAYPDAQLFLDLQGHSEGEPLEPGVALLSLLRQLGVEADRIPAGLEDRAGMWRSELTGRRALIILDNAASSAQVRRLLPASPTARTLVTSRRRLAGLDGGHPESLPMLAESEAVALLGRIAGERVAAEPDAALELVRRCGCLPLAIRLAGARLAHRPRWAVADLVRRLGESALPELAAEDRTVASAFALSYGQLPAPAQRLFRLLGMYPAERFRAVSVAALAGMSPARAQDVLDDLVDVHLVEEPDPDRYRLHDLVRQYAGMLADALPGPERRSALAGLVDFYLYVGATLNGSWMTEGAGRDFPTGTPARPDLVAIAVAEPGWLEEQRPALSGVIQAADAIGATEAAWLLARVNWNFLFYRSYFDDLIAVMRLALDVARRAGDGRGVALISNYLASGLYRTGQHDEALVLIRVMLDYHVRTGDVAAAARARSNYAGVLYRLGRPHEALEYVRQSLRDWRRLGFPRAIAGRHTELAGYLIEIGQHELALRHARLGLQTALESDYELIVAYCLKDVGEAQTHLGRFAVAERLLVAAHRMIRRMEVRASEIDLLRIRGLLEARRGRPGPAVEWYLSALGMAREYGQEPAVAVVSNELGVVLLEMGDVPGAAELHRQALAIARRTGHLIEEGRALSGLAACVAWADPVTARRHRRQAEAIFQRIGVPERPLRSAGA